MNRDLIKLHLLESDNQLRTHIPLIRGLLKRVIKDVQKLLPFSEKVDVVVYRYLAKDPNFTVTGRAPSANLLWLSVDPSQKSIVTKLKDQLPRVVVHELHHISRWQGSKVSDTLIEAFISEGLAGHFEEEVLSVAPSKFYVKFSEGELRKMWNKAQNELYSKNYNYSAWFHGTDPKIPRHAGYAIGYWLIKKYVTEKASTLVNTPARQITKNMV